MSLTIGSLFSGIGGLELGLERAGLGPVIWQAEQDEYCRRVLRRHWPEAIRYKDVRHVTGAHAPPVDVICGGPPCQSVSQAAARVGRGDGWLWPEYFRVLSELRPRYGVVEQPEAIRYARRGLDCILRDLAVIGYDATWRTVRASDIGAPHRRARVWVVAYPNGDREPALPIDDETPVVPQSGEAVSRWGVVPDLRVADGLRHRILRRSRLGNAVVPQVAEVVGRVVMALEARR